MTQTRIYLPLHAARLRELADTRQLSGPPLAAFAVTASIERSLPMGDEEEWEYIALCEAVAAAGELREKDGAKRVVAAADVDPDWVRETARRRPGRGRGDRRRPAAQHRVVPHRRAAGR